MGMWPLSVVGLHAVEVSGPEQLRVVRNSAYPAPRGPTLRCLGRSDFREVEVGCSF